MLQILFYLYCAIGLIIFSFGVWNKWLDPNQREEKKKSKKKWNTLANDSKDDPGMLLATAALMQIKGEIPDIEDEELAEIFGTNKGKKIKIPFSVQLIVVSVFWPLVIVGCVIYVLLGLDNKETEVDPRFNEKAYSDYCKKWAKQTIKTLKGVKSEKNRFVTLMNGLGSIRREKLSQYRVNALLETLDRHTHGQNFSRLYKKCFNECKKAEQKRYYDIKEEYRKKGCHVTPSAEPYTCTPVIIAKGLEKVLSQLDKKTKEWLQDALGILYFNSLEPDFGIKEAINADLEEVWQFTHQGNRLVYRYDEEHQKIVFIAFEYVDKEVLA
ncbi:hypothetical protein OAG41_02690 [Akkermansiaceae bacterium]|nr:hypothetical protein [Akkermansiaceae bacterium]